VPADNPETVADPLQAPLPEAIVPAGPETIQSVNGGVVVVAEYEILILEEVDPVLEIPAVVLIRHYT
jgi:hypothetical protein